MQPRRLLFLPPKILPRVIITYGACARGGGRRRLTKTYCSVITIYSDLHMYVAQCFCKCSYNCYSVATQYTATITLAYYNTDTTLTPGREQFTTTPATRSGQSPTEFCKPKRSVTLLRSTPWELRSFFISVPTGSSALQFLGERVSAVTKRDNVRRAYDERRRPRERETATERAAQLAETAADNEQGGRARSSGDGK